MEALNFAAVLLRDLLDNAIERRAFSAPGALEEERLWNQARILLGMGDLFEEGLSLDALDERLARIPAGGAIIGEGRRMVEVSSDVLLERIRRLRNDGRGAWRPPFVTGDLERGSWIWSRYSDHRVLERRRNIIEHTWRSYGDIVARVMPGLRTRLQRALCIPAILRERVQTDRTHGPTSNSYFVPQPEGSPNAHDLNLGDPFDFETAAEEMRAAIQANRPHFAERILGTFQNAVLGMWGPHPVTDETYRWLTEDLHAINLSRHWRLPNDRY